MDDWEEHFVEKSRRRFGKERHERRRDRTRGIAAVIILALIFVAAILGLNAWT